MLCQYADCPITAALGIVGNFLLRIKSLLQETRFSIQAFSNATNQMGLGMFLLCE